MQWTDERVEKLIALHKERLTASQIAKRLGGFEHTTDGGRTAVCGKINRLQKAGKLPGPDRTVTRQRRRQAAALRAAKPRMPRQPNSSAGLLNAPTKTRAPEVVAGPDIVAPLYQRRTLQQLTGETCRWPHGDPQSPDFHFCGAETVPGKSYCEFHNARAFLPTPKLRVYAGKPRHNKNNGRLSSSKAEGLLGVPVLEDA